MFEDWRKRGAPLPERGSAGRCSVPPRCRLRADCSGTSGPSEAEGGCWRSLDSWRLNLRGTQRSRREHQLVVRNTFSGSACRVCGSYGRPGRWGPSARWPLCWRARRRQGGRTAWPISANRWRLRQMKPQVRRITAPTALHSWETALYHVCFPGTSCGSAAACLRTPAWLQLGSPNNLGKKGKWFSSLPFPLW